MHMDIAAVVMTVRVGAYQRLVSVEMLAAKFLAQLLRPVYGQSIVRRVAWVKRNDVVVALYVLPFLVLAVLEIRAHTRYGKILAAAIQRGNAVVLPENEPPVFIKGGLHGKFVMFKS